MSDVRLPRPQLRDDFRKRLRSELMNEAVALAEERRLRSRSFGQRLRWWIAAPRLRAIAVVATLVVMLVAGAGAAAAGSLPGDPGFGLKRAVERVQLALAPTDEAKVQILATQVQRRLDELTRAASLPDRAPTASAEYEAAVDRFAAAVEALRAAEPGTAHDAVDQVVQDARERHLPVLEHLKDRLPADAKHGIDRAIDEERKLSPGNGDEHAKPTARPTRTPDRDDHEASPSPRETERPRTTATPRPTETLRATETPRPTETPRATETSRGDRATETPHR